MIEATVAKTTRPGISPHTVLVLPELPPDFVRLTHFTSRDIAEKVLRGDAFKYKMLSTTTDAFSNALDAAHLIATGVINNLSRKEFGQYVVVMDLPNKSHRMYLSLDCCEQAIPNGFVRGIIDRDSMNFFANSDWNPDDVQLPEMEQRAVGPSRHKHISTDELAVPVIPIPVVSDASGGSDVW
jgi:hypothetical protein